MERIDSMGVCHSAAYLAGPRHSRPDTTPCGRCQRGDCKLAASCREYPPRRAHRHSHARARHQADLHTGHHFQPIPISRSARSAAIVAPDQVRYDAHRPPMRRKRVLASGMRFRNGRSPNDVSPPARRCRVACAIEGTENAMKISARNQINGKILEVKKGATTAHIRLEIAPDEIITASITNEAVDELGLKVGVEAIAVIKASDVMIAID